MSPQSRILGKRTADEGGYILQELPAHPVSFLVDEGPRELLFPVGNLRKGNNTGPEA